MISTAQRMQSLPGNFFASLEKRVTALQEAGEDVIRLDIGSPDLPPPAAIVDALAQSACRPDSHGYQPHAGTRSLRQAWAHLYRQAFGVELDSETEVMPLLGSKEGIFHLTQAFIDPGDIVLVPDPGYMTYSRAAGFAGGEVYSLPLLPERGYLPDFDAVPREALSRAKMLWLNYPNNPTGAVAGLDFFIHAVAFARKHNLLLCHDAAYSLVTFDGYQAPSLLQVPYAKEVAVEFNSLSKSHNLAGWRVGVAAGSPQALRALFHLKTNLDSGHFLPVLQAAAEAMTGDQAWLEQRNQVYRQRRDAAVEPLRALGFELFSPRASIYVWCPVLPGWTCLEFVTYLLENAHVSLAPGTVFGERGEGYFRLSLTSPLEKISEALNRIKSVIPAMERKVT